MTNIFVKTQGLDIFDLFHACFYGIRGISSRTEQFLLKAYVELSENFGWSKDSDCLCPADPQEWLTKAVGLLLYFTI